MGKLTARERVAKLLDAGSFVETDALVSRNGDYAGVVTGSGTVQDRPVYVFAQDFTVHGGAMGQMQARRLSRCWICTEDGRARDCPVRQRRCAH